MIKMKQSIRHTAVLLMGCAASVAYSQIPTGGMSSPKPFATAVPYALTDSDVLMTDSDIGKAKLHSCQPLAGETVIILQRLNNVDGMQGLNLAKVLVAEGTCKGQSGWVGTARLAKVQ